MESYQSLLARAVASIAGKSEERAIASLFSPGGTHALTCESAGLHDFGVVAFVVILPPAASEGVCRRMEECAPSCMRSEGRCGGQGVASKCDLRGAPDHNKKN